MIGKQMLLASAAMASMNLGRKVHGYAAIQSSVRAARQASDPLDRRSRGKQAKPKRKPNRLHISRRVRRKHRRAA